MAYYFCESNDTIQANSQISRGKSPGGHFTSESTGHSKERAKEFDESSFKMNCFGYFIVNINGWTKSTSDKIPLELARGMSMNI